MSSNEIALVGSALFVAYLAYSNSKLNKKISNLQSEISLMRESNKSESSEQKSVIKSDSKVDKNSINDQPKKRDRLSKKSL
jgi:hypothetical protein